MLDRRFVADNIDLVAANSVRRGATVDVARFAELDKLRRQLQADIDRLNHEAGQVSRSIGKAADAAEREALAMLPKHGATPAKHDDPDAPFAHHVEIPRGRLDASVPALAAAGWAVEVAGRRYRPAGSVAWNVTSGIDWF